MLHTFRTRALPMRRIKSAGLETSQETLRVKAIRVGLRAYHIQEEQKKVQAVLGFPFIIR